MTLYPFNQLDEQRQAEMILENGVYMAERRDEEHAVIRCQLEGFYVEVFYHREYNTIK